MIFPPRKMAPGERMNAHLYNALLDYVRRTTPIPGRNTTVDYTLGGCRINGTPGGSVTDASSVRPFAVRWHDPSGDAGQWEIYLPDGCFTLGASAAAANKRANTISGHEDDDDGWKILRLDESEGSADSRTEEGEDGEGRTITYRSWSIVVHGKPLAKLSGVDKLDGPCRPIIYAAPAKKAATGETFAEESNARYCWGDAVAITVATVTVDSDGGRTVIQSRDTPYDSPILPSRTNFDIEWMLSTEEDGDLSLLNAYCVRQTAAIAGIDANNLLGDTMTDVKGATKVYCHVLLVNGRYVVEIVMDPQGMRADDANTWILLYSLGNDVVEADYRQTNLANIQIYR